MPATYTKEVILTGDTNPQGDSFTINNLDNVSWVTTSTNNAGVNPIISFTIADWTGSQGSTRTANFAVRHWLYDAGDPQAIHEVAFQIIQHAENQVTVTTTQATSATAAPTQATNATAAPTQATNATAAPTQATNATAAPTQATTEAPSIQLTNGNPAQYSTGGGNGNLPFTVTPTSAGVVWSGPGSNLTVVGSMTWVTDANGTTAGNIPTWITNVSASTDAAGSGFLSYTVESQLSTSPGPSPSPQGPIGVRT